MKKTLVVCPREPSRQRILETVTRMPAVVANDVVEAARRIAEGTFHLAFIDLGVLAELYGPPGAPGNWVGGALRALPGADLVVLGEPGQLREITRALRDGAANYLTYPIDRVEAESVVSATWDSLMLESGTGPDQPFWRAEDQARIRTRTPKMQQVFHQVRMVAPTRTTVLLTGETGTGKGLIARLIHQYSNRPEKPFIAVHCGAIPDALVESELFGHEKGAFTGALKQRLGKFEIAGDGTIFLDEVGTMGAGVQVKLLQVLQDRTLQRVGGHETVATDARIVAATNADLKALAEKQEFRSDLYFRLNVFPIEIPPLRERLEDLPQLVAGLVERMNALFGRDVRRVAPAVLSAFRAYSWPGNIRELENVLERAFIVVDGPILNPNHLPSQFADLAGRGDTAPAASPLSQVDYSGTLASFRQRQLECLEKEYLRRLLAAHRGRIDQTAAAAGIGARQLHKLMARHGLRKESFRGPQPPAAD